MRGNRHASVIVVGAGVAGLLTARVLSDHVARVWLIERDRLPDNAVARAGVPQGRHAHILPADGQRQLERWFPGLGDDLVAGGAVTVEGGGGRHPMPNGLGSPILSMSQPLLEYTIRRRLLRDQPSVSVIDETAADRLLVENGRVTGVRNDRDIALAELVVACTGRHTRFLDQLAMHGFAAPAVSAVRLDLAVVTRVVRRRPGGQPAVPVIVESDRRGRSGRMVPVEDDRWMITLGARGGEVPPIDPFGCEAFARSLPSRAIADVLAETAEETTPVRSYRMATELRRHVECLERTATGFLVLGDAVRSPDPEHMSGVMLAARQAEALGQAVARYGVMAPELAGAFYRAIRSGCGRGDRLATGLETRSARSIGPAADGCGQIG